MKENKYFIFDREISKRKYFISKIKYIFHSLFLNIIVNVLRHKKTNKKYYASICAIFKNEAKYLGEWIEYNKIIGIDHFYLYNNNSTDDYYPILKKYIDEGTVELIQWEKNQAQMEAYNDCITKKSFETNWLGFIDIDEFIVPIKDNSIGDFLKKFENRGSVSIYWKMFCSSGLINRSNGFVTNDFNVCWPKLMNIGKCFYNTSYKFEFDYYNKFLHHMLWTKMGFLRIPPVNAANKFIISGIHRYKKDNDIQINHYFTKSYDEYKEKKAKGDVYFKINPHDEEYFYEHEMKCTSVDYSIYKYLVKLKLKMEEVEQIER